MSEREEYLTEQIITYLGNKRSLLNFINGSIDIVMKELKKKKSIRLMFFLVLVLFHAF